MEEKSLWQKILRRYFINGLNGMALGLFCTLIVGLIIKQIGGIIGGNIGSFIIAVGNVASICTGAVIGIGAAHSMSAPRLVIFSSAITGLIGANAAAFVNGTLFNEAGAIVLTGAGDPLSAFIAVVAGVELGNLVSGKTKVDIIITPMVTIICGAVIGSIVGPPLSAGMIWLGNMINIATELQPFLMGIVISVIMGVALTLPISSAALSIILGLSGLPAGAATIGCSTQMIGFAVASFRENKWDGLFAQGIGTSMLQVPNIVRNPLIWIPPTLASAILGPLSTVVFKMENNPAGGGMGTSGLVGQIMTWQTMAGTRGSGILMFEIILLHFVLPAILTLVISEFMRKKGYIKFGDMKLNV
ncbi:PTS transporter subunit IIC [Tyzzerella sp. An114]|uniref:PTS transporter subunit IIC n=1 Tax=Tyzzerella sp. An114 TaxID=1965545 RepID=UPI0023BA0E65|nr:PTS sugar transporter subunit IIC [Tyzzerella sp. An114]